MSSLLARRVAFVTVLRHRDYRIYYLGLLASVTAHQGMVAAQGWLVYDMTSLPAALGYVAAAQAVPALFLSLLSGALADRFDPRRFIALGQGISAMMMAALGVAVLLDAVAVWHVAVSAFVIGIAQTLDQPSRRAIWPVLVPRAEMLYAASLNQGVWNGTRAVAPAVATGIIAIVGAMTGDERFGAAIAFFAIAAGFASMVVAMGVIHLPEIRRSGGATVLHDIADGLVYTWRQRILFTLLVLSLVIGFFGLSYQYMMPAFAQDSLGLDTEDLGFLLSASGVGGIIGVVGVASFGAYQSRAWLIGFAAAGAGAAVMGLASSALWGGYALALVFAAASGAINALFQVAASTVLNLLVPDHYRGRVFGLRGLMWNLMPLGALQAGLVATWVSVPFAIALGGAVIIIFTVLVFIASPQLRRVRSLVTEADEGRNAPA
ncbi:MAG: MFS transporter [Chloroflexota bacterium]